VYRVCVPRRNAGGSRRPAGLPGGETASIRHIPPWAEFTESLWNYFLRRWPILCLPAGHWTRSTHPPLTVSGLSRDERRWSTLPTFLALAS
jgi:hypothetical protein